MNEDPYRLNLRRFVLLVVAILAAAAGTIADRVVLFDRNPVTGAMWARIKWEALYEQQY